MADKKGITPLLPFIADPGGTFYIFGSVDGWLIAKVLPPCDGENYNAHEIHEYIVRACNAFPQMLEALELAEYWLMRCVPMVEIEGPRPLPIIRGAIAAAKGEGQ